MVIKSSAISCPGKIRIDNQDNLYIDGIYRKNVKENAVFRYSATSVDRGLFAVTDGMGGGKYGEVAALMAVEDLKNEIKSPDDLLQYLHAKNDAICEFMKQKESTQIGTTFAGIIFCENHADIINIGDSKIFRLRNGELKQISRDHTTVQQMMDFGIIDKDASKKHVDRHRLTQYLGVPSSEFIIEPYEAEIEVQGGDVYLLCTDGLTDMLEDPEIEEIITTQDDILSQTETLHAKALENGGRDNITIIQLHIE